MVGDQGDLHLRLDVVEYGLEQEEDHLMIHSSGTLNHQEQADVLDPAGHFVRDQDAYVPEAHGEEGRENIIGEIEMINIDQEMALQ
jgi:hypothetical protein